MAGIVYQSDFRTLNGIRYKLKIWDKNYTGTVRDFNVTQGSIETSFDATGEEKLTQIICSNIGFEFIVQNTDQEIWINSLRASTIEEKDIYIILENFATGTAEIQWSGFMLLDLGNLKDESFPYGQKIKGVDGLALLKDIDFVPTPLTNTPPYANADTYRYSPNTPANSKYNTYIEWIVEILKNAGFANTAQGVPEYEISTSVYWFNIEHASIGGTLDSKDPLKYTACSGFQFYKQDGMSNSGDLYYKPKNCYQALQMICRAWGMRCVMYGNVVYFIQLSNYRKVETGTTAIPINIISNIYDLDGTPLYNYPFIGNNGITRYSLDIENSTGNLGGLQKLAGTTWGEYPQIKKVATSFPSISNYNAFDSFPLIIGNDTSPRSWATFGRDDGTPEEEYGQWAEMTTSLGVFNDAYLLDGFYMMVSLMFMNTHTSAIDFQMAWTLRAKPSSQSTWNTATALVATHSYNTTTNAWQLYWEPLMEVAYLNSGGVVPPQPSLDGQFADSFASTLGGQVDDQLFFDTITVPSGATIIDIIQNTPVGQNNNLMPTHPDMIGDWDFEFVNMSNGPSETLAWECQWHGAVGKSPAMPPYNVPCWKNIQLDQYPSTSPTSKYQNPLGMWGSTFNAWYINTSPNLNLNMFSPVSNGAVGSASINTQYFTNTNDSYTLEIKDTFWGDTQQLDVQGSLKVWNGSAWVYTDYLGRWGIGTTAGTNSFTEQLCADALNMQNVPTQKGNYLLALSSANTYLATNMPKYVNPIGVVVDKLTDFRYFPMKITNNIDNNEVKGMWSQFIYNAIAAENVVISTGGGGPVDQDGGNNGTTALARMGGGGTGEASMPSARLIQPVLGINDFKLRNVAFTTLIVGTQGSTGSSGGTTPFDLNIGDTLILEDKGRRVQLVLTSRFIEQTGVGTGSTTISFQSINLRYNITNKSRIYVDQSDMYNQSVRKTKGQIAGFDIDADGIAKGGIEITGWLDSDTMTGASANNIPTAESVKAYVDSSSGGTSGLTVGSMIVCDTTTSTTNLDGVANAVIMKFDTESVSFGLSSVIVVYGNSGIEGVADSSFMIYIKPDAVNIRTFEFAWNVTANTENINNRLLSGIRIQEGEMNGAGNSILWNTIDPTTIFIYDRGAGSIRKGSTGGSILITHATSSAAKYYRMQFWKEKGSNASTKAVSVLNGTQWTIKQLK